MTTIRRVPVMLPVETVEELDRRAEAAGTSRADIIRELIRAGGVPVPDVHRGSPLLLAARKGGESEDEG